jgi:hypothetical protein
MMPQLDQDIDPEGSGIKRFRKIMGIFTQLPFEDKILYFDSREEYLAFFRWELEKAIQDAWYFPRWLIDGPKGHVIADLMAKKTKYSRDQLVLEDPNSDKTMSDRIFWGTGQRLLTPIRIPGVDEDHDFFYPHRAEHFLTDEHRQKFRYTNKPSQKELLHMVKQYYPNKVKESSTILEWREKILQVDFAALESLQPREMFYPFGSILYIDVKTRMPMGIWISGRKRLFLPNEGRDWEHAKVSITWARQTYFDSIRALSQTILHVLYSSFGESAKEERLQVVMWPRTTLGGVTQSQLRLGRHSLLTMGCECW